MVVDAQPASGQVVFLHGWGGSARGTWAAFDLPDRLESAGLSCLVLDLPGHGPQGGSHEAADYDSIVGQVADLLPDAPVDIVGFSLGGKIALSIAARSPARVRRMVIAGVGDNIFSAEPGGEPMRELMAGGIGPDVSWAVRTAAVYALQSGGDRRALAACLNRRWQPPTTDALRSLRMPILLANGEEDAVIGDVSRLSACLRDARIHRMAGIDHLSTPFAAQLHELAFAFLTERRSAPGPLDPAAKESTTP